MGRQRYTVEQVSDALRATRGNLLAASRQLGCDRHTVARYVERFSGCEEAMREGREMRIDLAESVLDKALFAEEAWAVQLVLRTIGKGRGYTERLEHTGDGGGPIQMTDPLDGLDGDERKAKAAAMLAALSDGEGD